MADRIPYPVCIFLAAAGGTFIRALQCRVPDPYGRNGNPGRRPAGKEKPKENVNPRRLRKEGQLQKLD